MDAIRQARYTVERHGDGWAIYSGRDATHHGLNLGHLTECSADLATQIESALNAALARQEEPVAWLYEHTSGMKRFVALNYDTGGLRDWSVTPLGRLLAAPQAIPREPTEAMLQIGAEMTLHRWGRAKDVASLLQDVWRAMYDAARQEQEGK